RVDEENQVRRRREAKEDSQVNHRNRQLRAELAEAAAMGAVSAQQERAEFFDNIRRSKEEKVLAKQRRGKRASSVSGPDARKQGLRQQRSDLAILAAQRRALQELKNAKKRDQLAGEGE
ncbi:hypothetical protein KIPB_011038, partial [Kipferlia bialata]